LLVFLAFWIIFPRRALAAPSRLAGKIHFFLLLSFSHKTNRQRKQARRARAPLLQTGPASPTIMMAMRLSSLSQRLRLKSLFPVAFDGAL